ncbi:4-hydroxybenzoate polyprenyl transferase [Rubidibacter lacunae KORDI 51-2]|uniref:4-hydroxybenzoate solanesyltransferase n=1 Tax=Rubidibacter lacunae KORDI 51-2 TaxID=582515 RepID=U5DRF8_9CHRO|nr:4-hydroxybenzoate solanesyltransferase [Rubidibacter lacunae]ERN43194.1 4-hydroxybenzoate polyprenyl transferase [Rubidibacter lacunae KORDI 51-2]
MTSRRLPSQLPSTPEPTWLSIVRLLRWNKPAGRLILAIPALWAVVLAAEGTPPLPLVGVILLGSLATSAAGCAINDLWDREIDPQVERTRSRPLASKALSVRTGIVVAGVALACAAVAALYLNRVSFMLSVAAVPVIVCYPLAKRFFPVPQLVLSIAWGFTVAIGWSAIACDGQVWLWQCSGAPMWLLWGATLLWTLGFDTVYAMADREDDRRIGINSSALFFGDRVVAAVSAFFAGTSLLLAAEGIVMHLHVSFWATWAIASALWIRECWQLSRPRVPPRLYGQVFRENVAIGFTLLAGVFLGSIW